MRFQPIIFIVLTQFAAIGLSQSATTQPAATQPNSRGIIVGPDTTVFTGPILPDGSVDYVAAVNAVEGRGISPQDNAECVLIHLVTLDANEPADIERRGEIERLLGVPIKPNDEVFWHPWPGFQNPIPTDDPQSPGFVDRFDRAKMQPWSSQDMPDLAAWLKTNEPALALVSTATQRSRLWIPIVLKPSDAGVLGVPPPDLHWWREIVLSLCIRSMLKLHEGDAPGALDDLLVAQRLGNLLEQSPQLITRLVGAGCQSSTCSASWRVLQESRIPPEKLRQWSSDMLAHPPISASPRLVVRRLRYEFLSNIQMMAVDNADRAALVHANLPVWDWNRILRFGNSFYDDLDRSLGPDDQTAEFQRVFNERLKQVDQIAGKVDDTRIGNVPMWLLPKPSDTTATYSDRVGATFLSMTIPNLFGSSRSISRTNEQLDWTARAGVALAIYRQDHGEYPASLDALIPRYLPRLPENKFVDPVGYERRGSGYVIRNVRAYDAHTLAWLANEHLDYDWTDIIIRTDRW
jgi:hypothetical protein